MYQMCQEDSIYYFCYFPEAVKGYSMCLQL